MSETEIFPKKQQYMTVWFIFFTVSPPPQVKKTDIHLKICIFTTFTLFSVINIFTSNYFMFYLITKYLQSTPKKVF